MPAGALDRDSIVRLINGSPPLVERYICLEDQLQPNGFDLTLREVATYQTPGSLGRCAHQREISRCQPVPANDDGFLSLGPGPYLVTFNEVVNLPKDLMALGRPRSTLLRCGVTIHTAVWDAGYSGRSQAMLMVSNPLGFRLELDARILQLVFLPLANPASEGYRGAYQGEGLLAGEER